MTKKYNVVVVEIDKFIEEAIVLLVDGVIVKCFVSYSPFKIEEGKRYDAEFEMVMHDSVNAATSPEDCVKVEMIGDGFSCVLAGYLDGAVFRSFVEFTDQEIHYEYPHLNEKFIEVTVDRIDVAF